jgi:hypothetical protein
MLMLRAAATRYPMMGCDTLGPELFYTDNVANDEQILLSYFPNSLDPGSVS